MGYFAFQPVCSPIYSILTVYMQPKPAQTWLVKTTQTTNGLQLNQDASECTEILHLHATIYLNRFECVAVYQIWIVRVKFGLVSIDLAWFQYIHNFYDSQHYF